MSDFSLFIIFIVLIFFNALLATINFYLDGVQKEKIKKILEITPFIITFMCWYLFNYVHAIVIFVLFLLFPFFLNPLSARIATFLMRSTLQCEGKYVGYPSRKLRRISEDLFKYPDDRNIDALIEYSRLQNKTFFMKIDITDKELKTLFLQLMASGGLQFSSGHNIVASALVYEESLQYIIEKGVNSKITFELLMFFGRGIPLGSTQIDNSEGK